MDNFINKTLNEKISIGISQCLLGDQVRFDSGHKHSKLCTKILSEYFCYIPTCPEVGAGFPVPRKSMKLINKDNLIDVVYSNNEKVSVKEPLLNYTKKRIEFLSDLCGYIFMQKSPSCGVFRVKIYEKKSSQNNGRGIFAKEFIKRYPLIPFEEEGRLNDPVLFDNFITRVFIYYYWKELIKGDNLSKKSLLEFHTKLKYQVMSHSVEGYKELGLFLSNLKGKNIKETYDIYIEKLMTILKKKANRRTHTNTLQHLFGYISKYLNKEEKRELLEIIENYRKNLIPLIVPITLIHSYSKKINNLYLSKQYYLQPHPYNLSLRNLI